MTRKNLIILAAGGSLALLLGAFSMQYFGGHAPCELCLTQRWPHAAAVVIGVLALWLGWRWLPWLGALAALTTSALGLYHTGVERGWWQGPSACTGDGNALGGLSGNDLLSTLDTPDVVMCDQISWQIFGLSLANLNTIFALALALIWVAAARARR